MTATSVVSLTLPLPPTTNGMYRVQAGRMRVTKAGKRFHAPVTLSDEYVRWLEAIAWPVALQMRHQRPILGEFRPVFHYPKANRRDEDSWAKPILDGLQRCGVIANDKGARGASYSPEDRVDVWMELYDLDTAPLKPAAKPRVYRKPRPSRPTAGMIAKYRCAGVLV